MERIESFKVDHRYITPGVYLSRKDGDVITFDLRFKKPNEGSYLSNLEMHSVEHLFATYVRNSELSDRVIYFGPMGCRTGFYLLVRATPNEEVLRITKDVLGKIVAHEGEMFGQSRKECGNYRELDLSAAKTEAARYLKTLESRPVTFVYPE